LNGLIQTIPDDNEFAGLNQNAVDVLTHLNNQAQAISAGDANAINNINSAGGEQILQGGDVLLQPETVNLLSANLLEQGGIPNLNIEVNPPSNTITDETYPMLVSDETLGKINLDKEFLGALPKELVIETIVNQLSM